MGSIGARPAVAALETVDDVVGDAVALVLAEDELAREVGALGVVDEQVAQQERGPLDVAPALLEELEHLVVGAGAAYESHRKSTLARVPRPDRERSRVFHRGFTAG